MDTDARLDTPTLRSAPGAPAARRPAGALAAAVAALLLAGCAGLKPTPARLALPEPLAAAAAEPLAGLGGGREGRFELAGNAWTYRRGADRLDLFERLGGDRATADLERLGGPPLSARCRGGALELSIGLLNAAVRPFKMDCRIDGASPGTLSLAAATGLADSVGGTRQARQGTLTIGGVTLELRSLHTLEGTSLPVPHPAGYLLLHRGQPVAALDLTDTMPRLRRAAAADPGVAEAVPLAAATLAVIWDPAAR